MASIVDIQIGRLQKLLADRKLTLELDDAARTWLANKGYDPTYGARPLKRVIQKYGAGSRSPSRSSPAASATARRSRSPSRRRARRQRRAREGRGSETLSPSRGRGREAMTYRRALPAHRSALTLKARLQVIWPSWAKRRLPSRKTRRAARSAPLRAPSPKRKALARGSSLTAPAGGVRSSRWRARRRGRCGRPSPPGRVADQLQRQRQPVLREARGNGDGRLARDVEGLARLARIGADAGLGVVDGAGRVHARDRQRRIDAGEGLERAPREPARMRSASM